MGTDRAVRNHATHPRLALEVMGDLVQRVRREVDAVREESVRLMRGRGRGFGGARDERTRRGYEFGRRRGVERRGFGMGFWDEEDEEDEDGEWDRY